MQPLPTDRDSIMRLHAYTLRVEDHDLAGLLPTGHLEPHPLPELCTCRLPLSTRWRDAAHAVDTLERIDRHRDQPDTAVETRTGLAAALWYRWQVGDLHDPYPTELQLAADVDRTVARHNHTADANLALAAQLWLTGDTGTRTDTDRALHRAAVAAATGGASPAAAPLAALAAELAAGPWLPTTMPRTEPSGGWPDPVLLALAGLRVRPRTGAQAEVLAPPRAIRQWDASGAAAAGSYPDTALELAGKLIAEQHTYALRPGDAVRDAHRLLGTAGHAHG